MKKDHKLLLFDYFVWYNSDEFPSGAYLIIRVNYENRQKELSAIPNILSLNTGVARKRSRIYVFHYFREICLQRV